MTTRKADRFDQIASDEIELVPIMVNGNKDDRINIVVVDRGRLTVEGEGLVASWQHIRLQSLREEVRGFQTICMVYRDHELSGEGTGPWGSVDAYLWDLRGKDDLRKRITPEFLDGMAWLDGTRLDPYTTPAPLDFHVVTFELASPSSRAISWTHTLWEGAMAEFLAYDGKLSESERMCCSGSSRIGLSLPLRQAQRPPLCGLSSSR